jgi:hypothetical protein
MKKLAIPILICDKSLEIAFWISLVIKWHPREGAVTLIWCWNQTGTLLAMLLLLSVVVVASIGWLVLLKEVVVEVQVEDEEGLTVKATETLKHKRLKDNVRESLDSDETFMRLDLFSFGFCLLLVDLFVGLVL